MATTEAMGATGCLKHNRLWNTDHQEWIGFTPVQMTAIRQIYRYCKLEFVVQKIPCDECEKESSYATRQ